MKDYILKADEFSSLIDKMNSALKERAEEVCEALKQTLVSETAKINSLRKKHFDGMRIEELTDQWESMRVEDRGGKKGRYLLRCNFWPKVIYVLSLWGQYIHYG